MTESEKRVIESNIQLVDEVKQLKKDIKVLLCAITGNTYNQNKLNQIIKSYEYLIKSHDSLSKHEQKGKV